MSKLKIAVVLTVSILLQLLLREVWRPLSYIDFPLVVVVYIALRRDAWQALVVGTLALYLLDALVAERTAQRRQFATRRRVARRSTGPLRRR
jgi:hypothetical protein